MVEAELTPFCRVTGLYKENKGSRDTTPSHGESIGTETGKLN